MKDNSSSKTACAVALGCLAEIRLTNSTQFEEMEKALKLFLSKSPFRFYSWLCNFTLGQKIVQKRINKIVPNICGHYMARKICIENIVRETISLGELQQVIVSGGGLDTLLVRLASDFPNVTFIELDHPATQKIKRRALGSLNHQTFKNFHLHSSDFSKKSLLEILSECGAKKELNTLVISEGVFMYLPEEVVKNFFRTIDVFFKNRKECIFSYLLNNEFHKPTFLEADYATLSNWLEAKNEPFVWGLEKGSQITFLSSTGWKQVAHFDNSHRYSHWNLVPGEEVCVATIK